jgi:hypothetical protein
MTETILDIGILTLTVMVAISLSCKDANRLDIRIPRLKPHKA